MSYSTISYGSSGEDVKKLQKSLNTKGYSLSIDGVFGAKTRDAVRDYQKKSGLNVDGVVGKNTWGKLNSASSQKTKASTSNITTKQTLSTQRPVYQKSDAVKKAENKLGQWENRKPDEYKSKYSDEIESLVNEILNREKFSYDMNSDPLYRQYKQLYLQNGEKAMRDTVGQASSLTGGYSNSYAVTAGSQAYADYLDELNSISLDLRDRAYEMYSDEGDKLIEDVKLLRNLDGDDYDKYLDTLEQYYSDGDYLLKKLSQMSDGEFQAFVAQTEAWENDRDYAWKKQQDELEREEFRQELAFKREQAQREQANADRDYALQKQKLALQRTSSGGSSSSKSSSSSEKKTDKTGKYTIYPTTYKQFVSATGNNRILTEEGFYSNQRVKKEYGTYQKYLQVLYDKYTK